jgi:hypothetical protein
MKGIQVLGILVSLYLIGQTLMQYKKRNYRARRAVFWLSLWVLIGVLFAFPSLMFLVLPILTTQDAMMTTWVIGLVVGYVLIYQIYQRVVVVERKFTELVQNIAIHNYLEKVKGNPGDKKDE